MWSYLLALLVGLALFGLTFGKLHPQSAIIESNNQSLLIHESEIESDRQGRCE